MAEIIARISEKSVINSALETRAAELVAVWGRRRVGKTYLVRNQILNSSHEGILYFELTGAKGEDGKHQGSHEIAANFRISWVRSFGDDPNTGSIDDIFISLTRLTRRCRASNKRLVLFLDEFPWLCTPGSKFYERFVHLWNNVLEPEGAKVFLCGSATSWMLKKVVYARAGLAKRITRKIKLSPFSLGESMELLTSKGFDLPYESVLECCMVLGGIPYYLDALSPSGSIRQNLFELLLSEHGKLSGSKEYDNLFRYLFTNHEYYKRLIALLASRRRGFALSEISTAIESRRKPSGHLNVALRNLEECDFIERWPQLFNERRAVYCFLTDEYVRFYQRWIASRTRRWDYASFNALLDGQAYRSWSGFNFEMVCRRNIESIKAALGISGIGVNPEIFYAFDARGKRICQVDLLLDRKDNLLTLCEVKHHNEPYALNKQDESKIRVAKRELRQYLQRKRRGKREINVCFITVFGLRKNAAYHRLNPTEIELRDLFIRG